MATGKERRLGRLIGDDGRSLLVAVDHALTTGFAGGLEDMGALMRGVVAGGADGLVTHRGSARRDMPVQRECALVVHLSGSTGLSDDRDLKVQVAQPEDALALGADAVSVHVTLGTGSDEDRVALAGLGSVASACDRLGLPLLVMSYVRQQGCTSSATTSSRILHAARVAAELGADMVKAIAPDLDTAHELATRIPVPVVVAGGDTGSGDFDAFVDSARQIMDTGVAGLCVGRWVFGHSDPARATAALRHVVHGDLGSAPRFLPSPLPEVEYSL